VDFGGLVGMLQNYWKPEYRAHFERFTKLLTPEEIQEIRETLPNTHYTSMEMVDWMWRAMQRMGVRGGRLLEPGMGIGNFFGRIPQKISERSELLGVERNPLTGGMAKLLYPDAKIAVKPFQEFQVPNGSFDAAIGNVPFQDVNITNDPAYAKMKLNLHNYFIVKTLDKLKPGGMAALITSRYTMDSSKGSGEKAREEMANRADLIAAIRLPDGAFKRTARTEVVADLLIFRKRDPSVALKEMPAWTKVAPMKVGDKEFMLNKYWADNPTHVLGTHSQEGSMYGPGQYTVKTPDDFSGVLQKAMELIPQRISGKTAEVQTAPAPETLLPTEMQFAPEDVKPGAFFRDDKGVIKIKEAGVGVDLPANLRTPEALAHIGHAIDLRDALNQTHATQLSTSDDAPLKEQQKQLEKLYDAYRKKYGSLYGPKLAKVFGDDPEYPKLLSLENIDPETKAVSKADIFTKRTLAPYEPLRELPDDPKSAMLKVMAERGYLDTKLMADLLKKPEAEVVANLEKQDLVYQDPHTGNYHTTDEYLSGDVREKLKMATAAAETDKKFTRNVEALTKAQPEHLTIHDIQPGLGQTWIPNEVYKSFVRHLARSRGDVTISRDASGKWLVQVEGMNRFHLENAWGAGGIPGHKLVQYAMNQQQPSVYDTDGDGKRTLNAVATTAAREKLAAIKEEFRTVLRRAPQETVDKLEKLYNETFNAFKLREFDGEHLDFPGMSEEWKAKIRGYQKAAVWRILQEGRAGIFHAPGLGKTLTMATAGMEARRLKLSRKNMYTVPNHMVNQWREDFKRFYPNANVLAVTDADFTATNRAKLMSRIASGDWDAVIVPHSQFDLLPMSPEWEAKTIDKRLADYRQVLEELDEDNDKRTIKQIEKAIDKLESRLHELNNKAKDNTINFDQLGVDMLFVDEAHAYKAMAVPSKMGNVGGISNRASQRAFALEMKADFLRDTHKGRGLVFGTGTPITNTVGELYVMTKYLAPEMLEAAGIRSFDDWAANFATTITQWEYGPDGVTFKPKTSLSEFVNVPELSTMFRRYAEYLSKEAARQLSNLVEPDADRKDHMVRVTPTQEPLLQMIADRGDHLTKNPPRTKEERQADNWLKLSSDARKISLDPRLYDSDLHDDPGSKANKAVAVIKDSLDRTKAEKGTVVVFSDFFQHKDLAGKPDFNIFEDIRNKLVKQGVPRDQIAIIHEAETKDEKEALFVKVRAGKVRVLFGSTDKMGIGTNIQDKLKSELHLDQPWRPDQVEQREGRIIRSGNTWKKVDIHRFIAEPEEGMRKVWKTTGFEIDAEGKSIPTGEWEEKPRPRAYDLQMYQGLARKAHFQEQFLTGNFKGRTMEDVGGDVKLNSQMFEMAKAMATGNPDAIRKIKIEHDLRTYALLERNFQVQHSKQAREQSFLEQKIPVLRGQIKLLQRDGATWAKAEEAKNIALKVGDVERTGEALKTWLDTEPDIADLVGKKITVGGVETELEQSFGKVMTASREYEDRVSYDYRLAGDKHVVPYDIDKHTTLVRAFINSFAARARALKAQAGIVEKNLETATDDLANLKKELEQTSPYTAKVNAMEKEIAEIDKRLNVKGSGDVDEGAAPDDEGGEDIKKNPPGPGAMNVEANTPEGTPFQIKEITEALKRIRKTAGAAERIKVATAAADALAKGKGALADKLARVKATGQAMLDWYLHGAGRYTDFQHSVREWSGAKQLSGIEIRGLMDESVKTVPSRLAREAIVNVMESGGEDQQTLQDRAAQVPSRFRAGYEKAQHLDDTQRAVANNYRVLMDHALDMARKEGVLENAVEDYIQHIWKTLPGKKAKQWMKGAMAELNLSGLQPRPAFTRKRVWETYFEGEMAGAIPENKDAAFLVGYHLNSLYNAIADRAFIKSLFEQTAEDGRPRAVVGGGVSIAKPEGDAVFVKPQTKDANTGDYRVINHPALRRWKWVGEDAQGRPTFVQGDVYVHPEIYKHLKNVLGTSAVQTWQVGPVHPGRALMGLSSGFKSVILQAVPSFFHETTIRIHAAEHRVNPLQVKTLDISDPLTREAIKAGLKVYDGNGLEQFNDGLAPGGALLKIPGIGPYYQAFQSRLFQGVIPGFKVEMWKHAFARNLARYPEMKRADVAALTADQANAAFGEQNYAVLGRNKTVQDLVRMFALAPDFFEARARFVGQALRPKGREQLHALLLGAAALFILSRLLNKMLDGDPHWDKPFSLVIKGREYSLRTIQGDLVHLYKDPAQFITVRLNPLVRTAKEFLDKRDDFGRKRDMGDQLVDFVERITPIPAQAFWQKSGLSLARKALKSALQTFGINESKYRSAAELEAMKHSEPTPAAKRPQSPLMRGYRRQMGEGGLDRQQLDRDVAAQKLTPRDRGQLLGESKVSPLTHDLQGMPLLDALKVWDEMTAAEKTANYGLMRRKADNEIQKYPRPEQAKLRARVNAALGNRSGSSVLPGFLQRFMAKPAQPQAAQ
jgi:N12 class adenine-specific DNA methylase